MTTTKTNNVYVYPGTTQTGEESIFLEGEQGIIKVAGPATLDADGQPIGRHTGIYCFPPGAGSDTLQATIRLHVNPGHIFVGGNKTNGKLFLLPEGEVMDYGGAPTIQLDAATGDITLGGNNKHGGLHLKTRSGTETITLDASTGDITLAGADCAEYFAVSEPQAISPGTVLIAESEDMLIPSKTPYDKRVVGVVSGAGNYKPGILLGKDLKEQGLPIALNGKVYCNVDASNGAIGVGDLLTTSSTRGHAMKADDPNKSFGAIIGKALKSLPEGRGLIPILVALQ